MWSNKNVEYILGKLPSALFNELSDNTVLMPSSVSAVPACRLPIRTPMAKSNVKAMATQVVLYVKGFSIFSFTQDHIQNQSNQGYAHVERYITLHGKLFCASFAGVKCVEHDLIKPAVIQNTEQPKCRAAL